MLSRIYSSVFLQFGWPKYGNIHSFGPSFKEAEQIAEEMKENPQLFLNKVARNNAMIKGLNELDAPWFAWPQMDVEEYDKQFCVFLCTPFSECTVRCTFSHFVSFL